MLRAISEFLPQARDYKLKFLKEDVLAGLTVAIVALPLALGFGITSGASAAAGLYTAIIAGVVAAFFGGSNFQVSGPTGAMTVVLLPIVADYGVAVLPLVGVLAGLMLIVLALARVGRYVHYIPWPVITGFTTGIAIIIFLQQLPGFLGVAKGAGENILSTTWHTLQLFVASPQVMPAILALLTIVIMVLWMRVERLRAIPASMVALLSVSLFSLLPIFAEVPRIGTIPQGLPVLTLPLFSSDILTDVVRAALAIAVLAALESLLSAVVADSMTLAERHNPNRELFGQGLANIAASLFGGIPATAALARTAVNVRSGARTRLASIIHGLTLLLIMLFLTPLASSIPLAVLAGILMVVAMRMIELHTLRLIMRSTKSDAFVLLLTTVITIVFDLILAIEVGLIAAGVLFIIRMSAMFSINPENLSLAAREATRHESNDQASPDAEKILAVAEKAVLKEHILAYRIEGPIFFGAANRFFDQLLKQGAHAKIVILRMDYVPVMDATGADALQALIERLEMEDILVFMSGLDEQPKDVLERMGILSKLSRDGHHIFADTEAAFAHALQHIQQEDHTSQTRLSK